MPLPLSQRADSIGGDFQQMSKDVGNSLFLSISWTSCVHLKNSKKTSPDKITPIPIMKFSHISEGTNMFLLLSISHPYKIMTFDIAHVHTFSHNSEIYIYISTNYPASHGDKKQHAQNNKNPPHHSRILWWIHGKSQRLISLPTEAALKLVTSALKDHCGRLWRSCLRLLRSKDLKHVNSKMEHVGLMWKNTKRYSIYIYVCVCMYI